MPTTGNYFHLHLVSDSTGETLITVARAVAAQYANVTPVEHVYPLVRSQKQLDRVLDEIEEAPGIVLFTLLEKDLVGRLEAKCQEMNIPSLSIIGPVMQLFQAYLGAATTGRVGAQHILNAEYFKRIDALNYTMMHDDGQHVEGLEEADVVLVGVSRTSKTPTSIYLANRGIRTANVPLVPGIPHSASAGDAEKAAGGQSSCHARAPDSGPAEPVAEHGRSRQRHLYRPSGRHRRSRFRAAIERQIQLGPARRDAAIDRGDRRRRDETVHRPAAAADFRMTLWRGERSVDPGVAEPRAANAAGQCRHSVRRRSGRDRRARHPARLGPVGRRRHRRAACARESVFGVDAPARQVCRRRRPDPGAGGPAVQQAGRPRRRPPNSCARLPAARHELHSAVAVARDGKILFETVAVARMTMRQLERGRNPRPIWTRQARR